VGLVACIFRRRQRGSVGFGVVTAFARGGQPSAIVCSGRQHMFSLYFFLRFRVYNDDIPHSQCRRHVSDNHHAAFVTVRDRT
jgi:hypothetical protein